VFRKKNPASDRSCDGAESNITVISQLSLQTVMDGFCSPCTFHMLVFCFVFSLSPFPLPLCFHTQWRPFLPGLKYEVIDSAYISLYTGKSYSSLIILLFASKAILSSHLGKKTFIINLKMQF